jgi:hypothetical protein
MVAPPLKVFFGDGSSEGDGELLSIPIVMQFVACSVI